MPRGKRSPIDYTPQFGEGIFRPREVVEMERAAVADAPPAAAPAPARLRTKRTVERTNERTVAPATERQRVRHSFDVWQDQLLALTEIQAQVMSDTGKKPKVGELVQEALDAYIAGRKQRTNERTVR